VCCVIQNGEFHSAEHAGGETVSMAIATMLSQRFAWRVAVRILLRLKTRTIRIIVDVLGLYMAQRAPGARA
jgi:hypothetical protein